MPHLLGESPICHPLGVYVYLSVSLLGFSQLPGGSSAPPNSLKSDVERWGDCSFLHTVDMLCMLKEAYIHYYHYSYLVLLYINMPKVSKNQ